MSRNSHLRKMARQDRLRRTAALVLGRCDDAYAKPPSVMMGEPGIEALRVAAQRPATAIADSARRAHQSRYREREARAAEPFR
jgi:hypothetical protein